MSNSAQSTGGFKQLITRYQVAIFMLLTLIISWSSVPFAGGGLLPHGPMLAAFIVLALVSGRQGTARL